MLQRLLLLCFDVTGHRDENSNLVRYVYHSLRLPNGGKPCECSSDVVFINNELIAQPVLEQKTMPILGHANQLRIASIFAEV